MWKDLPHKKKGAVALTSTDALDNFNCFEQYDASAEGKGIGVRVKAQPAGKVNGKVPAATYVGTYPGEIYTSDTWEEELERRVERSGTKVPQTYAMDFFHYRPEDGSVAGDLVIDPSDDTGMHVAPQYAHHLTPYMNEPSGQQDKKHGHPNCFWVRNFARNRWEVWTRVPLRPEAELTLCYGPTTIDLVIPRAVRSTARARRTQTG